MIENTGYKRRSDMTRVQKTLYWTKAKRKIVKNGLIFIALTILTQMAFQYKTIIHHVHSRRVMIEGLEPGMRKDVIDHTVHGTKLLASYAVNLTGNVVNFAPPPVIFPLTLYGNAYIFENKRLCDIGKELTFLVMVHSATSHFSRRQSMRATWAHKDVLQHNDIRIVFLLGLPVTKSVQDQIRNEMALYGDIVQGNFLDSYHNLTHKAALSVRWVNEHCLNTKIIVKIDDDVFIPVFQYILKARTVWSNQTRAIYCRNHVTNVRRYGKWKVADNYFKGLKQYPFRSCMGFVQVMTADMFPSLWRAAKETPYFWIDDIYLSGLLVERVGGVTFYTPKSKLLLGERSTLKCFMANKDSSCDLFVGFARTSGFMKKIWAKYLTVYKNLTEKYLPKNHAQ